MDKDILDTQINGKDVNRARERYWLQEAKGYLKPKDYTKLIDVSVTGKIRLDSNASMDQLLVIHSGEGSRIFWVEVVEVFPSDEIAIRINELIKGNESGVADNISAEGKESLRQDMSNLSASGGWGSLLSRVMAAIEKKLKNVRYMHNVGMFGLGVLVVGVPLWVPDFEDMINGDEAQRHLLDLEKNLAKLDTDDNPFHRIVIIFDQHGGLDMFSLLQTEREKYEREFKDERDRQMIGMAHKLTENVLKMDIPRSYGSTLRWSSQVCVDEMFSLNIDANPAKQMSLLGKMRPGRKQTTVPTIKPGLNNFNQD